MMLYNKNIKNVLHLSNITFLFIENYISVDVDLILFNKHENNIIYISPKTLSSKKAHS